MKVIKNEETIKIGKELEKYIEWVGLTPKSFSEISKIPLSRLKTYFLGEEISIEDAKKIAIVLGDTYMSYIPTDKRTDKTDFMRLVRDYAEDHDIPQKEVAAYLNYSESAYSKQLNKESLTVSDIIKIANLYHVSTAHLTGEIASETLFEHFMQRQKVFSEAKILFKEFIEPTFEYQGVRFELPLDKNSPEYNALLTRLESSVLHNFWLADLAEKKNKYSKILISPDDLYDDLMQIVASIVDVYSKKVSKD